MGVGVGSPPRGWPKRCAASGHCQALDRGLEQEEEEVLGQDQGLTRPLIQLTPPAGRGSGRPAAGRRIPPLPLPPAAPFDISLGPGPLLLLLR